MNNAISNLPSIVGALPNYGKVLILLAVAIVLASVGATAKAGFWLAVVIAIMFVLSILGGRQFSWDGRTVQSHPLGTPQNPVQQAT